jgi:alkanesulfonate monooxygenase SsuD/methylene tetrahydromethanopterin reductase-like flavin-dependent oxidoreductase (luciferase family)
MAQRFVLGVHVMTYGATWPEVAAVGKEIDRLGYDFLLMHDHLLATQGNLYQPFFESYTTLAAWATMTSQVRLGHLTVGNPFRNPGVVAKATTTLDHISNGRVALCLGAGSLPEEFPLHGLAVGQTLAGRLHALDESLSIVTRLLDGEEVNFESKNYQFDKVKQRPRPLQRHVPVIVGATGEKIGLRIAAKYADYWQMSVDPSTIEEFRHKAEVLDGHCRDVGRDPALIQRVPEGAFLIRETREEAQAAFAAYAGHFAWSAEARTYMEGASWSGTSEEIVESLRPFRDAGASGVILQQLPPFDFETIRRLATEVRPALEAGG